VGIWPFSRNSAPEAGAGAGPDDPVTGDVPIPAAHPPESSGEWATLPAVQPTFEPIGLTLGARSFEDSLVTRQAPQPFLAPLGHEVTTDAPTGTVGGVVTPAVQRFAAPRPSRFGVLVPDAPPAAPAAPSSGPQFGATPETLVTQRSTLAPDPDLLLRTLSVVDDGAPGGEATVPSGPAEAPAAPLADLLGGPESGVPLQASWEPALGDTSPSVDEPTPGAVPTSDATFIVSPDLGDGRPRRLGLGEPMTAVPSPIQRLLGRIETEAVPPAAPSPTVQPHGDTAGPFPVPRLGAPLSGLPPIQRRADQPSAPPATPRPLGPAPRPGAEILIFESPSASDTTVSRSAEPSIPVEPPAPPAPPPAPPEAPAPASFPAVQREAETTPGPGPEPGAPPAAPGAVAVGPGGVNLDELAKRLYGRLSSQLRAELRLDRERSGFLSDLGR
jgi:hypothetical protein